MEQEIQDFKGINTSQMDFLIVEIGPIYRKNLLKDFIERMHENLSIFICDLDQN